MDLQPVILEGDLVRLEPLAARHATGEIAGSTSYLAVEAPHLRLEIGATWLNPRHQRTGANTEAKLLLLRHAFEQLGCRRVEFKTDSQNRQSRAALARIGATRKGPFARTGSASTEAAATASTSA